MAIGESPSRIAGQALRSDSRTEFRALARRDMTLSAEDRQYLPNLLIRHFRHFTKNERWPHVMQRQTLDGAAHQLGISDSLKLFRECPYQLPVQVRRPLRRSLRSCADPLLSKNSETCSSGFGTSKGENWCQTK